MPRYGSREIMDVVIKDIRTGEPVVYLETLTTSSIEVAGETVYARGGKGNPRLIGWDSDKDITLNMEDALISRESLALLVGGKFTSGEKRVHQKEALEVNEDGEIQLKYTPDPDSKMFFYASSDGASIGERLLPVNSATPMSPTVAFDGVEERDLVIADYYFQSPITTKSITVTSDIFPGTYMLEGTTLWRREDGVDVEAVFTIPKMKILPNFTIPMANSGDPEVFTFTADVLKSPRNKDMFTIDLLEDDNVN